MLLNNLKNLIVVAMISVVIMSWSNYASANNIKVDFQQVPQQARSDFFKATEIIEQCLDIRTPITIKVSWIPRGPTGFAVYRPIKNQSDFLIKNAWYPAALAHQLRGQRDSALDDMNLFFSAKTNWYFSNNQSRSINSDETDFINVALHEILHGLGVSSATYVEWQDETTQSNSEAKPAKGSVGLPNEFINYFSFSFGKLPLDGTPTLYDTFIRTVDGDTLFGFENPSVELAEKINGQNFFHGPNARRANGGKAVPVVDGNLSHISLPLEQTPIMLPNSGVGESVHQLDPIVVGMLKDLGWRFHKECPL